MQQSTKPLVSAIIPNYNYARYLTEAVESVLGQTYGNIEVIVVDDGSADNSLTVLESFGASIKVINQRNAGVSTARNNGVSASKGEYLAFLDPDDVWHPTKIEKQVDRILSNSRVGLVHVGQRNIDAEGKELGLLVDGKEGSVSDELLISTNPVILGGGSGLMVSRTLFETVGGFDPRLSTCADWDIFYQIASRSEVSYIPEVLLDYRYHGSNMHGNLPLTEKDALYCLSKVFASADHQVAELRRPAYAKSHIILSGSYFYAGKYLEAVRHGTKAVYYDPRRIAKLLDLFAARIGRNRKKRPVVLDR